jgi:hypothetical protein
MAVADGGRPRADLSILRIGWRRRPATNGSRGKTSTRERYELCAVLPAGLSLSAGRICVRRATWPNPNVGKLMPQKNFSALEPGPLFGHGDIGS